EARGREARPCGEAEFERKAEAAFAPRREPERGDAQGPPQVVVAEGGRGVRHRFGGRPRAHNTVRDGSPRERGLPLGLQKAARRGEAPSIFASRGKGEGAYGRLPRRELVYGR